MFCQAQNVLGIDFGSEWIKLAVVQRGSSGVSLFACFPFLLTFCTSFPWLANHERQITPFYHPKVAKLWLFGGFKWRVHAMKNQRTERKHVEAPGIFQSIFTHPPLSEESLHETNSTMAQVQIVFNEASKRKSPNVLAFEDTERQFGDTALVKPHKAMTHTRELLGKGFKAEILKSYGPHYFPYEIVEDEERGAIKIKEGERFLSPEVLVAMMLTYGKSLAQAQTKEKVSDCVITVPSFFRQFERQVTRKSLRVLDLHVYTNLCDFLEGIFKIFRNFCTDMLYIFACLLVAC
jgi:hypothetical protein